MKAMVSRTRAAIVMIVIVTFIAGLMPVYAADETKADVKTGSQTVQTTADKQAQAIEKYGHYKGKNAKKIPIITYHNVTSDRVAASSHSSLVIGQSEFEQQMKWLRKNHYRTINCEEFYLWYKGKIKLPPKSVLVTFDDGYAGVVKYALPVMKKQKTKGTCFVVGKDALIGDDRVTRKQIKKLSKSQDLLEFQSHTYDLHRRSRSWSGYSRIKKDALRQKKLYGFEYLAYPFGTNTKRMRKAYKDAGIKMAFTYGNDKYATRKQNIYKIERIKISANRPMSEFRRWFDS